MHKFRGIIVKTFVGILFALLILSFAVWGIGDTFRPGHHGNVVAEVGDQEISEIEFRRSFGRQYSQLQQNLGGSLSSEMLRDLGLPELVLGQLVTRGLLDQQAQDLGLTVTDDQIRRVIFAQDAFRDSLGQFDRFNFEQFLRANDMRHVGPTRVELGTRTIFNLLGPLSNPARVKRQIIGVFDSAWTEPLAQVLKGLGHERAWVVYGDSGLDELSTTGPSQVAELKDGTVTCFEVVPEDAGLPRSQLSDLTGGDAAYNAAAIDALLAGEKGPYRDIVVLSAAAALIIADKASDLKEGGAQAADAIDSGAARQVLDKLVAISREAAAAEVS